MHLCQLCNLANDSSFPLGECGICGGKTGKTDQMVKEAQSLLKKEDAKTFSISTVIPKDWLINEEKAWDESIDRAESVKNFFNRRISSALAGASGARYLADGEVRLVFDYAKGAVELQRNELFVFGRYKKHSAGLSQSRWKCSRCDGKGCRERRDVPEHLANGTPFAKCAQCEGKGKLYESIEERIGEPMKKAADADEYVLHASGREDVDATNSAGRPFVLELKCPKKRKLDLDSIAREIAERGDVSIHDQRIVPRSFVEVVTESHFDKTYEAEVEFAREIGDEEIEKIRTLEGKMILQQTPRRVAHRRADLVRHRRVKHIEVVNAKGANATLIVEAEAGTYIKELISSDDGRTNPSVAGILGMNARCKRLEVTMISDAFLDFCLETQE